MKKGVKLPKKECEIDYIEEIFLRKPRQTIYILIALRVNRLCDTNEKFD